jgi:hypothetical protein
MSGKVKLTNENGERLVYIEYDLDGDECKIEIVEPAASIIVPIESAAEQESRKVSRCWFGLLSQSNLPKEVYRDVPKVRH